MNYRSLEVWYIGFIDSRLLRQTVRRGIANRIARQLSGYQDMIQDYLNVRAEDLRKQS